MIKRRYAALAAIAAGALGIGIFSTAPANAAQTTHTTPATHSTAAAVRPLTSDLSAPRLLATATVARKTTPGAVGPDAAGVSLTCSVFASGMYLIQPGGIWGPYGAAYAVDALGDYAWVDCNLPVVEIVTSAELVWSGVRYPTSNPTYDYNSSVSRTNYGIVECAAGGWQTGGIASITLPPGYQKSSFYLEYLSPASPIAYTTCIPNI